MSELKPGLYRHFKGRMYRLLHVAKHSETLEEMVVYQALYGDQGIWYAPPPCGLSTWNGTATPAPGFLPSKNEPRGCCKMQQPREKRRVKSEKKRYFLTKMIKISPEGTPILFTFLFSLFTQEVLQIFCNTSIFA